MSSTTHIPTIAYLRTLLADVVFRDWKFHAQGLGACNLDGYYLQVQFEALNTVSGQLETQHGRKWYISRYALPDEVIKTCWLAVELALRHEAMEDFKYKGYPIFNPHHSVDYMMTLPVVDRHHTSPYHLTGMQPTMQQSAVSKDDQT